METLLLFGGSILAICWIMMSSIQFEKLKTISVYAPSKKVYSTKLLYFKRSVWLIVTG